LGFTEEVGIDQLSGLGHERGIPVADDLGSGALLDLAAFRDEPAVATSLEAGADVVCFSGDKLLGGPQAGILLGRQSVIDTLKNHPLARAVRVDKLTLAALEGTLLLYQDPERARAAIPVLRYMSRASAETLDLAEMLAVALRAICGAAVEVTVEETSGKAGGGALPLLELPSHAAVVRPIAGLTPGGEPVGVATLEEGLRRAPLPVVGRVAQDALYLDVLSRERDELPVVAASVARALELAGVALGQGPLGS
jgi:L-seryl-tRNA(Ser) seleniumtransferase